LSPIPIAEFIQPNIYKKYSVWKAIFRSSCSEGNSISHLGTTKHNRSNYIKSPASGAGNVSEPILMSPVGRVREVVCAWISVFLQSERWEVPVLVCLRSSCGHVTEVGGA